MDDDQYQPGRPYDPPPVFKPWPNDGGFNEWRAVPDPFGDDVAAEGQVPVVVTAKFKSSSRQAEIFIHDPVAALRGVDETISSEIGELNSLPDDTVVSTFVVNHHRTLAKHIIRAVALVEGSSVSITIHKEEDGS